MGSKYREIDMLKSIISKCEYDKFCDVFGGSGVVLFNMTKLNDKV